MSKLTSKPEEDCYPAQIPLYLPIPVPPTVDDPEKPYIEISEDQEENRRVIIIDL